MKKTTYNLLICKKLFFSFPISFCQFNQPLFKLHFVMEWNEMEYSIEHNKNSLRTFFMGLLFWRGRKNKIKFRPDWINL